MTGPNRNITPQIYMQEFPAINKYHLQEVS